MAKFYSIEDFLAKGVASGSGVVEDETSRTSANGAGEPRGNIGAVAPDGDDRDDGDVSGQGATDVADAGHSDVPATSAAKKPAKRA